MPLNDIDVIRRRFSIGFPIDLVDFIVYAYNEQTFEEKHFKSVNELIYLLENRTNNDKSYWIEVINRSSVNLPKKIEILCKYFNIHRLTMEDITTLAAYMKVDFFYDQPAIYLLMKIISWNGERVDQQQISFYLTSSKNILLTFQEHSTDDRSIFDSIRNRLRQEEKCSYHLNNHKRLKQMNIDYLFSCLFDAIIDRYIFVIQEIAEIIDQFDDKLMTDKKSLTLETFHSIYRLKHDLLHLRILCNPLKDIICRIQRTTEHERYFLSPHAEPTLRFDMKHHLIRRQINTNNRSSPCIKMHLRRKSTRQPSIFFNENTYMYLSDLNDHINHLIDSLELQRESVSILISFWFALNNNEIQETLKILMLITALFMPCLLLIGLNSTNFKNQPQYEYKDGYYITLGLLAGIITAMTAWYRLKRWI